MSNLAVALLARDAGSSVISVVVETRDGIVGHVAFSPVRVEGNEEFRGYILAPLAVRPGWQKQGLGARLVKDGLQRLVSMKVDLVLVYGDPAYYGRFGFAAETAVPFVPPYELRYPFGWQGVALGPGPFWGASGHITCLAELLDPALW